MWEFIDKVIYINLDKRKDRNEHMKKMTETFGDKVIRFSAVQSSPGYVGCSQSHIAVIEMAVQNNWKNILILEDDAQWNKFEEGYKKLHYLASNPYDVIVLGGSCVYRDKSKLLSCQCAVGYLVNNHYYSTLLENYKNGLKLLKETNIYQAYALDQYWKHLQCRDNWFIVEPCLVYQTPDYSDIENRYVDYRDAFHVVCV
jgi:glycosyl transferase family 25